MRSHEAYRALSGAVADDLTNILALRTSGDRSAAIERISRLDKEEADSYHLRRKVTTRLDAPRALITNLGLAVVLWVVISSIAGTKDTVMLMVLVITYLIQISRNIDMIPDFVTGFDDLVTKLHRTLEYLEPTYETVKDSEKVKQLKDVMGRVDIKNVEFSYTSNSGVKIGVFNKLSLTIQPQEQVGIVGVSGAGKSTLASLLMRFEDVEAGQILVDGIDVRDVAQDELRKFIAYVPQEPLLFHQTIRENVVYFNPSASDEEVVNAARAAHAHEFITGLPEGYDTLVGERGVKLSGGQKQRVVLARSILKDAPIMIFDEATSALDSESEEIIQRSLPKIIGKRTAIVIAHRLSTVANLDRIIVLEKGKIKEQGTHAELLKQKGRYYSLWQKQTNRSD